MNDKKKNRIKRIYVRLNDGEYNRLHDGFKKSTFRKFSEYNRHILLGKPITVYTRNQSVEQFTEAAISLKAELNAIGQNFNQLVKKLHTMQHDEEIKGWAIINERSKELFFKKVDEIEVKMIKILEQWSHG